MKLVSCENCGVVIDLDRFSEDQKSAYDDEGYVKDTSVWDGDGYIASVECPCCNKRIIV